MVDGYIPKDQRKKILLLSDDLRLPSGVGVQSKEIVVNTAHRYNWLQVGGAIKHADAGKMIDISASVNEHAGIDDSSVRVFPYNGYGDPPLIRGILEAEKPDAILHFTDPRYWIWLYQMEHEIRQTIPIFFYHVWDDLPFPKYNENFYRSCDWIASISKQTHNIVRQVWQNDKPEAWQTTYIPHGINTKEFFRVETEEDIKECEQVRAQLFKGEEVDFALFYNNRNIRRKMTIDVMWAYYTFIQTLTEEQRKKCRLVMHTQISDENGTDLIAVVRDLMPDIQIVFSADRVDPKSMNYIYNNMDAVINLASNEGFGLGTAEALAIGIPIIVNVTGGLQDQCGFKDDKGNYLDPEVHYNREWGSNSDGKYREHGEWVVPVFPATRSLIGSPPTPYIFDDRCKWEDAALAIRTMYDFGKEERLRRGSLGREFLLGPAGMDATIMGKSFIEGMETAMTNFKPKQRVGIWKV